MSCVAYYFERVSFTKTSNLLNYVWCMTWCHFIIFWSYAALLWLEYVENTMDSCELIKMWKWVKRNLILYLMCYFSIVQRLFRTRRIICVIYSYLLITCWTCWKCASHSIVCWNVRFLFLNLSICWAKFNYNKFWKTVNICLT